MRLRLTHRFLLLLIACLAAPASQAMTDFTLQLRWTHQFQFAGYYVALEWGYYEDAGLAVEIVEGGTDTLEPVSKLLAGDVDFAIANSGVTIRRMAGEPIVALAAIMQTSPIVWIVRADSGIHTPLNLAGKRLMLMPPPESAELLAMLRREGVDTDQLGLIHRKYAPHKSREHLRFEAERIRELVMPALLELGHMKPARWESIAQSYVDLGMVAGPVDLRGFLYEEYTEPGRTWPYMMALGSVAAMLLISLVTMRIAHLNRKLLREAARRQRVEQELLENQEKLYKLVNTDQLTGVWNRLKLDQIAREEIERARRYQYPISLIFMDVDNFKAINDVHGHGVGDQVLIDVANLVGRQLREADWLCRWGGEEFLVLLPHAGLEAAAELAERLRTAVDAVIASSGERVTVSIGVAELGVNDALSGLIARADGALYRAKAGGRDQVALDFGN